MGTFLRACRSEVGKGRRTASVALAVLAPLGIVVVLTWYLASSGRLRDTATLALWVDQLWTTLWLPCGLALLAGLLADQEAQAGNWRGLRVRPQPPTCLYAAKFAVLAGYTLLGALTAQALLAIAAGALGRPGAAPGLLIVSVLLPWLVALPFLAVYLWIAVARGIGTALGLGMLGLFFATALGGTSMGDAVWGAVPWAWPVRLVMLLAPPLRGLPLPTDAAHTIAQTSAAALALTVALVAGGMAWFARHEVA
jgi:ABC-2 type transport system permease protein